MSLLQMQKDSHTTSMASLLSSLPPATVEEEVLWRRFDDCFFSLAFVFFAVTDSTAVAT